jgi:hypothetical protein
VRDALSSYGGHFNDGDHTLLGRTLGNQPQPANDTNTITASTTRATYH